MLRLVPVLAIGVLLSADALAGWGCRHGEDRSANIDLNGVGLVEVVAGPGDLEIAATAGAGTVVADGRACSETEEGLEGIRIITLREGDRVRVIADIEDQDGGRTYNRSLDLRVAVPAGIAVEVKDSSGNALIDGVASVTLVGRADNSVTLSRLTKLTGKASERRTGGRQFKRVQRSRRAL